MICSSIIILLSNLLISIRAQTFKSGYFDIVIKNKDLPTNSSNLIKSIQIDKTSCFLVCNINFICNIVIYNSNGLCTLCKIEALSDLIDSNVGQNTTVFQSQNQISDTMNGLINYWPIVNDLRDYTSSADMTTGPLDDGESIGFTRDRFNNLNGAVYMNPGYYILPPGIYFNNSFSFLAWIKVLDFVSWARIIDCGNGPHSDNMIFSLSYIASHRPFAEIYRGNGAEIVLNTAYNVQINTWFHIAFVYDNENLMIYTNGVLIANATSAGPVSIKRTKCFVGRSNWHVSNGDPDASACLDDLMLYNRALTPIEIQTRMNNLFN